MVFGLRLPLVLFLLILCAQPAGAGDADVVAVDSYADSLLASAERQKLHEERYWHILLHYKRGLFGLRSLVDDPAFFADPRGKHDPQAELCATIRSFFEPAIPEADTTRKHPVCRFAARYEWLRTKLAIDETRLPVPRCDRFENFLEQIRPESATLIFPTSHINSPASMYGHTLLTIETASKSKLLAYAVNYSALTTGSTIAPIYIAKGLLGGYPGYFSILPYYAKLQEYSDVADRDIWEYPLNLDSEEIRRLVLHVYELEEIHSNYFFFSENCSYGLLFLLEAARPSVRLTDRFHGWVIPLATIRAVRESGMIEEAVYRPSKSTKVSFLSASLPAERREEAWEIARGKREATSVLEREIPREEKIRVCDLASEYLQYLHTRGDLEKNLYVPRFLKTLEARSRLGESEEWRYEIPVPVRPDDGHRSNRLAIAAGALEEEPFQELRLRPAYHGLLDDEAGYKRGSQIIFGDVALRYYSRERRLRLEAIDLIDIVSIAPRSRFLRPMSWKVNTGFYRRALERRGDHLVYGLSPGAGRAYDLPVVGLWYVMLESDLRVGGALDRGFSLGAGASTGVLKNVASWWKAQLAARYANYPLGEEVRFVQASFGQNFRLGANTSLSIHVDGCLERDVFTQEARVGANAFF